MFYTMFWMCSSCIIYGLIYYCVQNIAFIRTTIYIPIQYTL